MTPGNQYYPRSVYFMRTVAGFGPIKIGCSLKPQERLAAIQLHCPFELKFIALIAEGSLRLERQFHSLFSEHHLRNEWFNDHPDILAAVDAINAGTFDFSTLPAPRMITYAGHPSKIIAAKLAAARLAA